MDTATLRKPRLVVRPFAFVRERDFPGDPPGEIVLPIARVDRDATELFAREVRLRTL